MKHTLKKGFEKYIGKKNMDKIIDKNSHEFMVKEIKRCGYIIIEINQNEYFEKTMGQIINYFDTTNFMINIYGTMVDLTLFESSWNKNIDINIEGIKYIAKNIPDENIQNIRGIYGIENARLGNFAGDNRLAYMALIDNYYEKIIKISELKYGEIRII
jgi:sugar phosphate isomerase/epimerase